MLHSDEERVLNALINAAGQRQKLLANNLTNINTPGFDSRQDLDFGAVVRDVKNGSKSSMRSSIDKAVYTDFNHKPSYEEEMSQLFENQLKYVLLTRINGHIYQHMEEATQSGRGS